MRKPETLSGRAAQERDALLAEIKEKNRKYKELVEELHDLYSAHEDLIRNEVEYFRKLDKETEDFIGV